MQEHLLPHFNQREDKIDTIVLHCSAFKAEDAIKTYEDNEVSAHYIIDLDGTIVKLVDENDRAWHAGKTAFWKTEGSINSRSIGIEICNLSLGQEPYNDEQIEKLMFFCQKLIRKYNIKPQNIVGHSDVAPKLKADPGLAFPWKKLARNGVGLWYEQKHADRIPENDVVKLLNIIGYDTRDEESTIASAYAFRRRFLPKEVTVDNNIQHLLDNVYPIGNKDLLQGDKFLQTLKAVAYNYENA